MNERERRALMALRTDWAPNQHDVWAPLQDHIEDLNRHVAGEVMAAFKRATDSAAGSIGVVIEGRHGSGKTHLMCWVREQVQARGGYFVLMGLPRGKDFWRNLAHSYLRSLRRSGSEQHTQLATLLQRLAERAGLESAQVEEITGRWPLSKATLSEFVHAIRRHDPELGDDCQHTLRALVLLGSSDPDDRDTGEAFLTSNLEGMTSELAAWGIRTVAKTAADVVEEISRLLAITGPTLLAVDQIDTVFAQTSRTAVLQPGESVHQRRSMLAKEIGDGLMDAYEVLHRTVTVLSCLPASWLMIRKETIDSIPDRFRNVQRLAALPSPEVAAKLIAARFEPRFRSTDFRPPYPTWPILPSALSSAIDFMPRDLLKTIDDHILSCLHNGVVEPLRDLSNPGVVTIVEPVAGPTEMQALDARFNSLRSAADMSAALDKDHEDQAMAEALESGLKAWIAEQSEDGQRFSVFRHGGDNPSVHAMLKEIVDAATEDENHWSFRGIAHPHHKAVRTRLDRVRDYADLDPTLPSRKAFVLRNVGWPSGQKTAEKREEFENLGGKIWEVKEQDLRDFAALGVMLGEADPALNAWLRARRPAGNTKLLSEIFGPPAVEKAQDTGREVETPRPAPSADNEATMALGTVVDVGEAVTVPLESLRKHVAIFAGSGSGKTVLIRRLIEECALQGVSAIALDPNNDLARLGDPWPEAPPQWGPGDARKANEYFASVDVVVWTPRRESGRPLSLQPLPDFSAVLEDPDEFELALDTAVAALAPRARVAGNTAKMERGRAVLREALAYRARRGGTGLTGLIDLLAELPDDVTPLTRAAELAHEMAQTLTAAMINDPLFGGSGVPLDPAALLTPASGKKARVSVISMIGLPSNEQRQSFVNQLQMALFAWVKRNPAGDRPLGALFVMDEAQTLAPSGAMTACTESTLALASQARKYGLGLVFATQAPRGIHNRIVGNAATQFYGFLNSPVQITAAKEMAQAKASGVLDISRLTAGQFYAVGEGMAFQKLATPMCLSHHPKSALTPEEVLERART